MNDMDHLARPPVEAFDADPMDIAGPAQIVERRLECGDTRFGPLVKTVAVEDAQRILHRGRSGGEKRQRIPRQNLRSFVAGNGYGGCRLVAPLTILTLQTGENPFDLLRSVEVDGL